MTWKPRKASRHETIETAHDVRIEVMVNNHQNKLAAREAIEASDRLNQLLEENHFTVRIFRAAGGQLKQRKVT